MKFIILFLISFSAIAGFPPTTLKGQSQSTATTTFNFQVPNNQATKTATGTLVETGSQNLLSNPGFEHSTVGTDWNVSFGTLSSTASTPFGSAAASFTGSLSSSNIQSLTGSGTAQAGLNCLVSAYVKTASSNVQLCAIHNGTLDTNLCLSVNSNNAWAQYQIPTVCDATSTVARVRITTSVSTTFDVDNVYVGINPNISVIGQAQIAGESYFAGTANCAWDRASTTVGAFTADTDCPGPTISATGIGTWNTTDVNLPIQTITNLPAGKYKATFQFHGYTTAGAYSVASINDGTTSCQPVYVMGGSSQTGNTISCVFDYPTGKSSVSFQLYAASSLGTFTIPNSGIIGTPSGSMKFNLEYYPSPSTVVSTNNQDYGWTAYTPTSPNGSFGTLTGVVAYHKRQGSDLLLRVRYTTGTLVASEARISLPSGLTSSSSIATLETCGSVNHNYGIGTVPSVLIEPSVSYVTFGGAAVGSNNQLTKQNATFLTSSGSIYSFEARIPIQGWNNNNVIVGTFAGVNSTPNIANPRIYSAKMSSTGTITDEMGDFVNGNCTNATPNVCSFNSGTFTATPNCFVTTTSTNQPAIVPAASTASVSVNGVNNLGGSTQVGLNLICHGY